MTASARLCCAAVLGAVLIWGAVAAMSGTEPLELATLGWRFRLRTAPEKPSPVTVVLVRSTVQRERERSLREVLADVLELMASQPSPERPRVVVVDVLLDRPEPVRTGGDVERSAGQRIVAVSAPGEHEPLVVVHAVELALDPADARDAAPDLSLLQPHMLEHVPGLGSRVVLGLTLAAPTLAPSLYSAAHGVGHVSLLPWRETAGGHPFEADIAAALRLPMLASYQGRYYIPALSLAGVLAARCPGTIASCGAVEPGSARVGPGGARLPLRAGDGDLWLNLRKRFDVHSSGSRRAGAERPPEIARAHTLPDGSFGLTDGDGLPLDPVRLAGQVVLLADQLEAADAQSPLGPGYSPWSMHAQAMANMLEDDFLMVLPEATALLVAMAGLAACLGVRLYRLRLAGAETPKDGHRLLAAPEVLLVVVWSGASVAAMSGWSLWLPVASPSLAWIGGALGCSVAEIAGTRASLSRLTRLLRVRERLWLDTEALAETLETALEEQRDRLAAAQEEAGTQIALARQESKEETERARLATLESLEAQQRIAASLAAVATRLDATWAVLESGFVRPLRTYGAQLIDVGSREEGSSGWGARVKKLDMLLREIEKTHHELNSEESRELLKRVSVYQQAAEVRGSHIEQTVSLIVALMAPVFGSPGRKGIHAREIDEVDIESPLAPDILSEFVTSIPDLRHFLKSELPKIARSELPVLILGPTGSGKEIVAKWLWRLSHRSTQKLVPVDCAAIASSLLESELFGHQKGAFNEARSDRRGLFLQAERGILFLDEIGAMPLDQQIKLRRAIDPGRIRPVGADVELKVDVRVIAATSAPLRQWVDGGRFDRDLFERLAVHVIELPALSSHAGEAVFLAKRFLWLWRRAHGDVPRRFSAEALIVLSAHDWPGNARELKQKVGVMAELCEGMVIDASLAWRILGVKKLSRGEQAPFTPEQLVQLDVLRRHCFDVAAASKDIDYRCSYATVDRHLRLFISKALQVADWEVAAAVELLAKDSEAGRRQVMHRIDVFIFDKLARRVSAIPSDGGEQAVRQHLDELRRSLRAEYRGHLDTIWAVVEALRTGRLVRSDRYPMPAGMGGV